MAERLTSRLTLMLSHMIIGLGIIALLLAIFITWLIGRQVEKQLSARVAALVFLVITVIPIYQILRLLAVQPHSWPRPFFYMWLIFVLFCVLMAVYKWSKSRPKQ